eukprot:1156354-Pelagomonas_calceolata.AAC.3
MGLCASKGKEFPYQLDIQNVHKNCTNSNAMTTSFRQSAWTQARCPLLHQKILFELSKTFLGDPSLAQPFLH